MPGFTNRIAALQELTSHLDNFAAKVGETMGAAHDAVASAGDGILSQLDRVAAEGNPRLEDFKRQLEAETEAGNVWTSQLLDLIRQVEQGTIRADQAFHKFGAGVVLFEGQLTHVDDLMSQFMPTTGEVQTRIQDLAKQLKDADIGTLIEHLNEQYNVYAQELSKAVQAYADGKGSLERIAQITQQISDRLAGSETDALAQLLADAIDEGLLSGKL